MKLVAIGDIHGEGFWEEILEREDPDIVVYVGDYFDSYTKSAAVQIANFKRMMEVADERKERGKTDVFCIGNHDIHYFREIGYTDTSGYQRSQRFVLEDTVEQFRDRLQIAYKFENYLFTHAGVSEEFLRNLHMVYDLDNLDVFLNDLFNHQPRHFLFNGLNSYGDNTWQTPIWIRPRSLLLVNLDKDIQRKYIQVVGHTNVQFLKGLQLKDAAKAEPILSRYVFLDDPNQHRYLVVEDGVQMIKFLW